MRNLAASISALVVVALALFVGTAGRTAAAPAGFTIADFKGRYVGHFNGSNLVFFPGTPSGGIVRIDADGLGAVSCFEEDAIGLGFTGSGTYTVDSNGLVRIPCAGVGGQISVSGYLLDRGKTLEFELSGTGWTAAGTASIQ